MAGIDFRDRRLGNYNLHTADNGRDVINALYNGDNRLGFLMKDQRDNGMRYGVGIDNIGSPYRGVLDKDVSTPFGTLDYGYDGDTVAAGFTPNDNTQAYINALKNALAETPAVVSNAAKSVWEDTKANPMGLLQEALPLSGAVSGNRAVQNGAKAAVEAALRNAIGGNAGYGAGLANILNRR